MCFLCVHCKFYAQGTCLKGEFCEFAHNSMTTPPKKACIYYQRGTCKYSGRCRFEHSKSSWMESSASSSSAARVPMTSNDSPIRVSSGDSTVGTKKNSNVAPVLSSIANNPIVPGESSAKSTENPSYFSLLSDPITENIPTVKSDIPSEPCAENGGNERMDLCSTCGKFCLHPSKPEDREMHMKECEKNKQVLEHSQQVECSVCLERVLSKTLVSERKFGLLSECDHAFCIACIKKWRSSSSSPGIEVNSAARACPMCRKVSYYVIPSPIWSSSKEEKQEIINKYKAKLKYVDCRYFNFGNGHCRHGSHCFYNVKFFDKFHKGDGLMTPLHEVKAGSSQRNKSSKAKNKRNNKQNRATWDDDRLGFGEFVERSLLDAMLDDFEELFFLNEEAMRYGAPGDEVPESLTDLYRKLNELGINGSEDYESDFDEYDPNFEYDPHGGAIRLEPWQRQFFYEQTGCYDFDDFTDYRNFDYYFGSGTGGFDSDDEH